MEITDLWLGTQAAYDQLLFAQQQKQLLMTKPDFKAWFDDDYEEEKEKENEHFLLSVQDNIGVISISGSLINGRAGWARFWGVTGYEDIREALAKAVANPSVSSILLNVGSGGGHVAGCHETAQLIQRVDKVKPVVTYTGSNMMSAAIWLGSSGRYVIAAETAQVGSIGVLMIHQSHAKRLKEAGIDTTIVRAGSDKCLANPYENLSKKAEEKLQAQADYIYDIFIGHVASARGANADAADSSYGQGREFFGAQAATLGLIDAVGTYEDAVQKAAKLGQKKLQNGSTAFKLSAVRTGATNVSPVIAETLAAAENLQHNQTTPKGQEPMDLSQERLAAMAAGVDIDAPVDEPAPAPAATTQEPATPTAQQEAPKPATPDALAVLQGMLATAQADTVKAQTELAVAKAQHEALAAKYESQLTAFSSIARASVRTMGIHFGMSAEVADTLSNEQLLAEHSRLSEAFKAKFKTGRVSVPAASGTDSAAASTVDDNFLARAKKLPVGK